MIKYLLNIILGSFLLAYNGPDDEAGDKSATRSSYMDGNRVLLYYKNTTELSDWAPGGLDNVSLWPNDGTGTRMVDGIALMVGAKVFIENDQNPMTIDTIILDNKNEINYSIDHEIYFLQTSYREEMDHNFTNTLDWGFYPVFGYFNPTNNQDYPAMSDDPATWPLQGWPSTGSSLKWKDYWDGRFGKGVTYADLETYFVVNDAMDYEYIEGDLSNQYRYFPRPNKLIQSDATYQADGPWGGAGLRIEVRGFQWNNPLVRDALFWEYNITNISDYNITETSFGYWVDNAIGSETTTSDEVGYFDTILDLSYSWDYDGVGLAGVTPGIMGFAFLESPGISDDGIDNDNDGIIDEKRDNDKGLWIECNTDTDCGVDDLDLFYSFYNKTVDDLKPHWSGDEDMDWMECEKDEEGNCIMVDGVCISPNDDVGKDGVGFGDLSWTAPDEGECNGEPDCEEGVGCEPNFGETDVSESDMIGLTTFRLFPVDEHSQQEDQTSLWFYNDDVMWEMMSDTVFNQFIGTPANLVELFAAGVFELKQGQTERVSMAELHSFDNLTGSPGGSQIEPPALFDLKKTVQLIYETDYRFAQPPRVPTLSAEARDGEVLLSWTSVSESSRDPFLPDSLQYDFEGYKIYRSTDKYFRDAQVITDGYGSPMFYQPIFQCDKKDDIYGFSDITVFGTSYYLGDDTGLQHFYLDTDVTNGRTYYYAIVAYDYGLAPNSNIESGIPPSENNAIVELDENEYVIGTGPNVQVVIPKASSAGYRSSTINKDTTKIYFGTGSYDVNIVANNSIQSNKEYFLVFNTDTHYVKLSGGFSYKPNAIYNNGFSVYTCKEYVEEQCVDFNSTPIYTEVGEIGLNGTPSYILDNFVTYEFENNSWLDGNNYLAYMLNENGVTSDVFEGLQLTINPSTQLAKMKSKEWTAQSSDNPQIFIYPWDNINHRQSRIVPFDFEITFHDSIVYKQHSLVPFGLNGIFGSEDSIDTNDLMASGLITLESLTREYPFYIENTTLNDTMSLIGIDIDVPQNGFNVWEDRILVGTSVKDSDSPYYGTWVGTTCEIDFRGIQESSRPQFGDKYEVKFDRPFWSGDTLIFSTGIKDTIIEKKLNNEMEKIRVVPNPYVMTNLLEEAIYSTSFNQRRKLMFTHLPARCEIKIFTVSGVLVDKIIVDNNLDNGVAYWDLLTNESLEVAAGMYVYHVKDLVYDNGSEKIGKFAIIK